MKKKGNMYTSYMTCSECGNKFPIMRCKGQKRGKGHMKDMWCPFCKRDVKFVEGGFER